MRHLLERDFEFVQPLDAAFVDARRLAGGADEHAGEQIRQRRVVLPVGDQAGQHIGAAQEGAVGRRRTAEGDVVAAAGAGVAAVEHELLGGESRQPRLFVHQRRRVHQLLPVVRGVDVDLDDAGVGGDQQLFQAPVRRRRIAFDHHRQIVRGGAGFDRRQQVEIVLERGGRRHEHVQTAAARLDAQRGVRHRDAQSGRCGLRMQLGVIGVVRAGWRRRVAGKARGDFAMKIGQRRLGGKGVHLDPGLALVLRHPRQRVQRQAQADRRVAGREIQAVAPGFPRRAVPRMFARPARPAAARSRSAYSGRATTCWPASRACWRCRVRRGPRFWPGYRRWAAVPPPAAAQRARLRTPVAHSASPVPDAAPGFWRSAARRSRCGRCPAPPRPAAPGSATSARHPCASRSPAPSAATVRPDTTCPARCAAARRAPDVRASAAPAPRHARFYGGRKHPCSILVLPCRRSRQTWARRRGSGARRWPAACRRPRNRAPESPPTRRRHTAASRAGLHGCG